MSLGILIVSGYLLIGKMKRVAGYERGSAWDGFNRSATTGAI
jgi:hypothetical protein